MPRVNIYIRKEDLEKWEAIGDKPSFIHDAIRVQDSTLHGTMYPKGETEIPGGKVIANSTNIKENKDGTITAIDPSKHSSFTRKPPVIKTAQEAMTRIAQAHTDKDYHGLCKIHGTPLTDKGKCLQKGCKYA